MQLMLNFGLFLAVFVMSVSAHAETGCLRRHLKDAITLNESRLPKYSALTQGKSERISHGLLRFEKLGLLPAVVVDFQAKQLQKLGISIICDEVVSMDTVPPFAEKSSNLPDPISKFQPMNARQISDSIRAAYRTDGFSGVQKITLDWLAVANQAPAYHCLMRHFLDSIVRTANLAPMHMEQAERVGKRDESVRLSWEFIRLQLFGLSEMEKIDELAAPIQAMGVPILCRDVPVIAPGITSTSAAKSTID